MDGKDESNNSSELSEFVLQTHKYPRDGGLVTPGCFSVTQGLIWLPKEQHRFASFLS